MIKMTEARYNDLVYLTLKKLWFEPIFNSSPRECDIRVCMQMGNKIMLEQAVPNAAILLQNEFAPKSKTEYEIDTDLVFYECKDYVENHWLKTTTDEVFGRPIGEEFMKFYVECIIPSVMSVDEDKCAIVLEEGSND